MAELTYYLERLSSLKTERASYISHWKELGEQYLTRQTRFQITDRNRGDKRNQKIYNETGVLALRTLMSGMMGGMTNPMRPWLKLKTPDPDLNKYKPVKTWLEIFKDRMLELMIRSNIYSTFPMAYRDEGCFATTAYLMLEDEEALFRSYHFPIGSYYLALNERGRADTCYREFEMPAGNVVNMFGRAQCSPTVLSLAGQGGGKDKWIPITHAIQPNPDYDPRRAHFSAYKKFKSCYFENEAGRKFLQEKGFDEFPVMAVRWDVTGEDAYGSDCPGMQALGTTKQLQFREKRKGQLIDKGTNPPMGAPASMKNKRSSVLPGDVTYYEQSAVGQKFEPLYLPDAKFYQWVLEDIASCTERVKRAFYEDLFLMMAQDTRSNVTAREIAERHEEKLMQLGPVLIRQNDEHYDPLVSWISQVMFRNNVIPPPPPELNGMPLMVKYTSLLAQAMELAGVATIERLTSYVGTVAAGKPGAADLFNEDQAVILYAEAIGSPEALIRDPREVDQKRAADRQRQQLAQAASMAGPAADTVKNLSQADMSKDNALTRTVGAVQQAQQQHLTALPAPELQGVAA